MATIEAAYTALGEYESLRAEYEARLNQKAQLTQALEEVGRQAAHADALFEQAHAGFQDAARGVGVVLEPGSTSGDAPSESIKHGALTHLMIATQRVSALVDVCETAGRDGGHTERLMQQQLVEGTAARIAAGVLCLEVVHRLTGWHAAQQRLETAQQSLERTQPALAEAEARTDELRRAVALKQQLLVAARADVVQRQQQLAEETLAVQKSAALQANVQARVDAAKARLHTLQTAVDQRTAAHMLAVTALQADKKALELEAAGARSDTSSLLQATAELERLDAQLSESLRALTESRAHLQGELAALDAQHQAMSAQMEDASRDSRSRAATAAIARAEHAEVTERIRTLQPRQDAAMHQEASLTSALQRVEEERAQLEKASHGHDADACSADAAASAAEHGIVTLLGLTADADPRDALTDAGSRISRLAGAATADVLADLLPALNGAHAAVQAAVHAHASRARMQQQRAATDASVEAARERLASAAAALDRQHDVLDATSARIKDETASARQQFAAQIAEANRTAAREFEAVQRESAQRMLELETVRASHQAELKRAQQQRDTAVRNSGRASTTAAHDDNAAGMRRPMPTKTRLSEAGTSPATSAFLGMLDTGGDDDEQVAAPRRSRPAGKRTA